MKILFDSHSLVWFLAGDRRFSPRARTMIETDDTACHVSAVSAWEISNKVRLGKWPEAAALAESLRAIIEDHGFVALGITLEHARAAGHLVGKHRDPFDRMLAAQSQLEDMPLVTADPAFASFGTRVFW